jgi:hypothetical protein
MFRTFCAPEIGTRADWATVAEACHHCGATLSWPVQPQENSTR